MKKIAVTVVLLLAAEVLFAQIPESENNNNFAVANPVERLELKAGACGGTDTYDYFKTVFPIDGTLKIYVQATNTGASGSYLYVTGFDRRQVSGTLFAQYVFNSNVGAGVNITDTITLKGRAADTFYLRFESNGQFSYQFRYDMADYSENDAEPNNDFATSTPLLVSQAKSGHINYIANGSTLDPYDYYKTVFPADGTMKLYIRAANRGNTNANLYLRFYDQRQAAGELSGQYVAGGNTLPGAVVFDTIILRGRAADTFYYRFEANNAFDYQLHYEMTDITPGDTEPNNSFLTALPIAAAETKNGHVSYSANGSTLDPYDYYKTVFPSDGTLKIYVQGVNRSSITANLFLRLYDRRQAAGELPGYYIAGGNTAPGVTIYDTILLRGRAADSFYFRTEANAAFDYRLRYEMTNVTGADTEPNNTFAGAAIIAEKEIKSGHINYSANGTTLDPYDYYLTVFPYDGTLKIYVQGKNQGGGNGYLYLSGYDRRQQYGQLLSRYVQTSTVPPGNTVFDTITIKGLASDTFYYRFEAVSSFDYQFQYEMKDTSAAETEPNGSFASALMLNTGAAQKGHIGYTSNGGYDQYDIYKTVYAVTDSLKVYVQATNRGSASSYVYLTGYNNAQNVVYGKYISGSSTVPPGATIYDSVKILVTAPETIYNRLETNGTAFSYVISINSTPPLSGFSISGNQSVCTGDQNYTATGVTDNNVTYHWSVDSGGSVNGTGNTATVTWTTPGTHIVQLYLSNSNGTSETRQLEVIVNSTEATAPAVTKLGRILTTGNLPAGCTYQWYNNGIAIGGAADSFYNALAAGVFTVKFVTACGPGPVSNAFTFAAPAQSQTISFPATPDLLYTPSFYQHLTASASSGLPVTYELVSGPGLISADSLRATGTGTIIVRAIQNGNDTYSAAAPVTDTILVTKGNQTISFSVISGKILSTTPFAPDATASSGLPVTYTVVSGPAFVSGSLLYMTGAGTVQVMASQPGNANYFAATPVTTSFCIGLRQLDTIEGPLTVCPSSFTYSTRNIPGAIYEWSLSGGGVLTANGNSAAVLWQTPGTYTLHVKAYTSCDTVRTSMETVTVTVTPNLAPAPVTNMLPADNATGLNIPLTLSWLPGANTTRYDLYLWPQALSQPAFPLVSDFEGINYTVLTDLALNTNYNWKVVSKNACQSAAGPVQTFSASTNSNTFPDLVMDSISYPAAGVQGQPITVTWRVKNTGQNSTNASQWTDRIYLAQTSDLRANVSNILVKLVASYGNQSYLLPGQSYTQTKTVTLPPGLAGTYFLFVITDNYDAACTGANCDAFWGIRTSQNYGIVESNEFNNYRYGPITIDYGPLPDLRVKSVATPLVAFGNSAVTVTYSVKNEGAVDAAGAVITTCPQRGWYDRFFLSQDSLFDFNTAWELPKKPVVFYQNGQANCTTEPQPYHDYLEKDSSFFTSHTVTIPHNFFGKYYMYVMTNGEGDVFEGPFNTNNVRRNDSITIVVRPPADLLPTSIQLPPSVLSGQSATGQAIIANQGANPPLEYAWTDSVFMCSTPVLNPDSIIAKTAYDHINAPALNGGSSYTLNYSLPIPDGRSGQYYVYIKTDARNAVFEYTMDGNNLLRSAGTFTVQLSPPVDLTVSGMLQPDTVKADSVFTFYYKLRNQGIGHIQASWSEAIFVSTDSVLNGAMTYLAPYYHNNDTLAAGSERTFSKQVSIPGNQGFEGRQVYFFVQTDNGESVYEHGAEGNNISSSLVPVGTGSTRVLPAVVITDTARSDIRVQTFAAPANAASGSSITLNWTVKNTGSGPTTKTVWGDRAWLSADTVISDDDAAFGPQIITTYTASGLKPDSVYSRTASVVLPVSVSGSRYLVMRTDYANNVTNDSTRLNNDYAIPISITASPRPDLVVTGITALPATIYGSSQFYLKYTVQNQGTVATIPGESWADAIFINNMPAVPNAGSLGYTLHTAVLGPGASYTDSVLITVPVYMSGNYYLVIKTDQNDNLYEGAAGNANNVFTQAIIINAFNTMPAADLLITSVTLTDTVLVGNTLSAAFTIKNTGTNAATGSLDNALYLSADKTYQGSIDRLVNSARLAPVNLAAGDSLTTIISGKVYVNKAGNYYGIGRTNVRAGINEGNNLQNNDKASDTTVFTDARALTPGLAKADTLRMADALYYKVTVPANLDLSITLSTNVTATGRNALYTAFGRIPSSGDYDATGINFNSLNQQVLIAGTQAGSYYLKAEAVAVPVNEPVTLLAQVIPFSIIKVTPDTVGRGRVTTMLYGGGFKTNTQFVLRTGTGTLVSTGVIKKFYNSTRVAVTWNLAAVANGTYQVVAINPGNVETILPDGLTVQEATGYTIAYTPLLPSSVRTTGAGAFTYQARNTGNVDIPVLIGDITMPDYAAIGPVSTTGGLRRFTQYLAQYDSSQANDWYISNKTKVIPFLARDLAPGDEVSIRFTATGFQGEFFPLECRMFGISGGDFAREQIRTFEYIRLLLLYDQRAVQFQNDTVIITARAGSKPFSDRMMKEFVDGGLLFAADTAGLNINYACSRCVRNLPAIRPPVDSSAIFLFNPGGYRNTGSQLLSGNITFNANQSYLWEINQSRYWKNGPASGVAGGSPGWDLLSISGTLNIQATSAAPFRIRVYSLSRRTNLPGQLAGWSPAYDTTFAIVTASGGVTNFDANKFLINLGAFTPYNSLRRGQFSVILKDTPGPDTIFLKFTAYKPLPGERGVDGVKGYLCEQGSPGGPGADATATAPAGDGGIGGDGGDGDGCPGGPGGEGGPGGKGWGAGGKGGCGGKGGDGKSNGAAGGAGGMGGRGGDAGSNGGKGGDGGCGGKGGHGAESANGGNGAPGGSGGNSVGGALTGGNGGFGGFGGNGGGGCPPVHGGGTGGAGGTGGTGPGGAGSTGAPGGAGSPGAVKANCAPCTTGQEGGSISNLDLNKQAENVIDLGKATIESIAEGDPKQLLIEYLDQTTSETKSTGLNTMVAGADAFYAGAQALVSGGVLATWSAAGKTGVFALKTGNYINTVIYGREDYVGSTEVNEMIEGVKAISSLPDLLASLAKLGLLPPSGVTGIRVRKPCDPNEIEGPTGYGPAAMVSGKATLPYTIRFENDSLFAEVAAQRVVIRQQIHPKADPQTFRLGSFNFAGQTFTVPENQSAWFTVIPFDSLGYNVEVTAGLDIANREAFWFFQAVDRQTGLPPANPLVGFLPVNDASGKGTGFVNYSIRPGSTVQTGDSITARADIVFDLNSPVSTNTWLNIIDAVAPVSSITPLPATTTDPQVRIHYTGTDDPGGSGIREYDLYVQDNGNPPALWVHRFTGTDTGYTGEAGHTYTFYARATDHTGNTEELKLLGNITILTGSELTVCRGGSLLVPSDITGTTYQWQVNTGSGFGNISDGGIYSGASSATLSIINPPGTAYGYQYRCLVNGSSYSQVYTLKFTAVWYGSSNAAWENPANWGCGLLPDQYTDVIISAVKPNYPVISSSAEVRTLKIYPGAVLTVTTGHSLTILK